MIVHDVPWREKFFIGGDFNGHIGGDSGGYESAHEGFDFGVRNSGGVAILDFAIAYDLLVVNSFFKKEYHFVTFKSGSFKAHIDYFLTRADSQRLCRDCKVVPSEFVRSQHKLLVLDVEFNFVKWKRRGVMDLRVKWWNLTKENAMKLSTRITEEGAWRRVEDLDMMWEAMTNCIRKSTKEILGASRRGGNRIKGAWRLNEGVKEKVKEKKDAYTAFMKSRTDEEKEFNGGRYKAAKKVAKKVVAVVKCGAYDRLYQKLETKEVQKEVFKLAMARAREMSTRDLGVMRCTKDENGRVLSGDAEIKGRWQRYFFRSLNGK